MLLDQQPLVAFASRPPRLDVTLVEAPATLRRKADPATGLAVTDVWGSAAVPER